MMKWSFKLNTNAWSSALQGTGLPQISFIQIKSMQQVCSMPHLCIYDLARLPFTERSIFINKNKKKNLLNFMHSKFSRIVDFPMLLCSAIGRMLWWKETSSFVNFHDASGRWCHAASSCESIHGLANTLPFYLSQMCIYLFCRLYPPDYLYGVPMVPLSLYSNHTA